MKCSNLKGYLCGFAR